MNLRQHSLQVVLLLAFAALEPRRLRTIAAVGAELKVLVDEVEGARFRAFFPCACQNGFHCGVGRPILLIAADNGHNFRAHRAPPDPCAHSIVCALPELP
jgi:hypothetical protein